MATSKKPGAKGQTGPKNPTPAQLGNLKSWEPGQSGNPAGRPAKIYTVIKKMGFNKVDIVTAFQELAFYTQAELDKVLADKKAPVILHVIARAYRNATQDGDMGHVKELLAYVLGRPTQGLELAGTPGGAPIPVASTPSDIDYTKLPTDVLQLIISAQIKQSS